jgi:hypothetical protein
MTIPRPDANSIKVRFPEFALVTDAAVEFAIEEAGLLIDDTWIEGDGALAWSLLTAHLLAAAQATSDVGGRIITSESIGRISVSYAAGSVTEISSTIRSTIYGDRFLSLARRNHPPILSV